MSAEIEGRLDRWGRAFFYLVKVAILMFAAYLSYRVAKITGHWEFGMLVFMATGYLSDLPIIRSRLNEMKLYNKL